LSLEAEQYIEPLMEDSINTTIVADTLVETVDPPKLGAELRRQNPIQLRLKFYFTIID
jgi:hypothetical protein